MSSNLQDTEKQLIGASESVLDTVTSADAGDTKKKIESRGILEHITEDIIVSIGEFINPADFVHLLCSSNHFKNCLDKDLYWTQFCLRALVNTENGKAKEIFKHFTKMKRDIEQTFPQEMIEVFSLNVLVNIPSRMLDKEFPTTNNLTLEDFSENGCMIVKRPSQSYIAILIENRRNVLNSAPIAYGYLAIKPADVQNSPIKSLQYYSTMRGGSCESYSILGRFGSSPQQEVSTTRLIRRLVERNTEYTHLNSILQTFIFNFSINDIIQEYDGRDGRLHGSEAEDIFQFDILSGCLHGKYGRYAENDIERQNISQSSIRISQKPGVNNNI